MRGSLLLWRTSALRNVTELRAILFAEISGRYKRDEMVD